MPKYLNKIIAPAIIVTLIGVYYAAMVLVAFHFNLPFVIKIAAFVLPLAVVGAMIYVLIERIKEIRSGEEDDLGKY